MKTIRLFTTLSVLAICYPLSGGGGMRYVTPGSKEDVLKRIVVAAKAKGLDPALALAVAQVESTFNPNKCRRERKSESCGLFQVWVPTARYLKYTGPVADLKKPEINIELGTMHLQKCQKKFGDDVAAVACCHNAGLQRPDTRCWRDSGVADYVSKVSAAYTAWNERMQ